MQIYYFSRTGRSKLIAEELAARYNTEARKIDDHKNWDGKVQYMNAGRLALKGKPMKADFIAPDKADDIVVVFPLWAGTMPPAVLYFVNEVGKENVTAIITSLGSTMKKRDGFKKVIDVVGKEISTPDEI